MNTVWSDPLPMRVTTSASRRAPRSAASTSRRSRPPGVAQAAPRGIGEVAGELFDHRRQRPHRRHPERRPGGRRIHVEVGDRLCRQLVGELLAPLGGPGERDLLAVPAAEDEGAARPHAVAGKLAERRGSAPSSRRCRSTDRRRRRPTRRGDCRARPIRRAARRRGCGPRPRSWAARRSACRCARGAGPGRRAGR